MIAGKKSLLEGRSRLRTKIERHGARSHIKMYKSFEEISVHILIFFNVKNNFLTWSFTLFYVKYLCSFFKKDIIQLKLMIFRICEYLRYFPK